MKIREITPENKEYPQKLLEIKNHPKILYAIGNISLLNKNSIAIVGSRKSTEYGEKYAIKFAKELGNFGICIVSGLALRNRYLCTYRRAWNKR